MKSSILLFPLLTVFLVQPAKSDLMSFAGTTFQRYHANNCQPGSSWGTTSAHFFMPGCIDIGPDVPPGPPSSYGGDLTVQTSYVSRQVSAYGGGPLDFLTLAALSRFSNTVIAPGSGWGFLTYRFLYDSTLICLEQEWGVPCHVSPSDLTLTLSLNEAIVDVPIWGTGELLLATWVDFSKPINVTSDLTFRYTGADLIGLQTNVDLAETSPIVSAVPELSSLALLATVVASILLVRRSRWNRQSSAH